MAEAREHVAEKQPGLNLMNGLASAGMILGRSAKCAGKAVLEIGADIPARTRVVATSLDERYRLRRKAADLKKRPTPVRAAGFMVSAAAASAEGVTRAVAWGVRDVIVVSRENFVEATWPASRDEVMRRRRVAGLVPSTMSHAEREYLARYGAKNTHMDPKVFDRVSNRPVDASEGVQQQHGSAFAKEMRKRKEAGAH